ncbi:hypothetical protein G7Y79_00033g068010 [Physcia stellaris]|nr:hypothetical protein G7Y79_00033g068010 [Physcia stellaris]
MSDPLSIAAGVIGVLTAAAQISTLLIRFTNASRNVPAQARHVLTEVGDISGILSHLQSFLFGIQSVNRSRMSLLRVDHTVAILSGCVMTFSELEKILDGLETGDLGVYDCIKWAQKESDIGAILQRLQSHKASLSLMLNILNGATMVEAKNSVDRLHGLISRCYEEMSQRVQSLELKELHRQNQIDSAPDDGDLNFEISLASSIPPGHGPTTEPAPEEETVTPQFTEELKQSWVYSRNSAFRLSTHSSEQAYTRWSCLSRLSMSEVSDISVLNLAITVEEVKNPKRLSQTWSGDQDISAGIAISQVLPQGSNATLNEYAGLHRLPLPSHELDDETSSIATTTSLLEDRDTVITQPMNDAVVPEGPRSTSPVAQDFGLVARPLPILGVQKPNFQADIQIPGASGAGFQTDMGVQVRTGLSVLFEAASLFEFNIDKTRTEAGYPYLTYVAGEIFEVIQDNGELWLAKNQDDETGQIGWIWNQHFLVLTQ